MERNEGICRILPDFAFLAQNPGKCIYSSRTCSQNPFFLSRGWPFIQKPISLFLALPSMIPIYPEAKPQFPGHPLRRNRAILVNRTYPSLTWEGGGMLTFILTFLASLYALPVYICVEGQTKQGNLRAHPLNLFTDIVSTRSFLLPLPPSNTIPKAGDK